MTDVTYHEGARIKKLTVAGRDISDYTIFCEDEPRLLAAANDMSALIERACDVKLALSTDAPSAPYIALRYVRDEALGSVGYRWSVDEAGLTIECSDAYRQSSAMFAVRRFLETRLDWYGLVYGFEDLRPAGLVAIEAGESGGETPDFDVMYIYSGGTCIYEQLDNDRQDYGPNRQASHGIVNNRFAAALSDTPDNPWSSDQPCWLDDEFYNVMLDDVGAYIKTRLDAGQVIGKDFFCVDLGAGDNSNWCQCKECTALLKKEGSNSAHVLTFANLLSEELGETYPGLAYAVFAYSGTNRPPKTVVPGDDIWVTFCFEFTCSEHPLDGSRCTWGDPSPGVAFGPHDNVTFAGYLAGWTEISDNIYVWYYGLPNSLLSMSYLHLVHDDITFLYRSGVKGVMWETEDSGYDTNRIAKQLAAALFWDADMSDERFNELYDRALCATYGDDAAPLVGDLITLTDRVHEASRCQNCWAFGLGYPAIIYSLYADPDDIAEKYDISFELVENALASASSAKEERRLAALSASVIMKGSVAAYPKAQAANDAGRMAELSRRYALMVERLATFGVDVTDGSTISRFPVVNYPATIEDLYPEGEGREKLISPQPFD